LSCFSIILGPVTYLGTKGQYKILLPCDLARMKRDKSIQNRNLP
jgi:hypothetical protein